MRGNEREIEKQCLMFRTVSVVRVPGYRTGDQPVARPLLTHRTAQIQNKRIQTSMHEVGFEPTIPVFERAKTVHALDRAANVIGRLLSCAAKTRRPPQNNETVAIRMWQRCVITQHSQLCIITFRKLCKIMDLGSLGYSIIPWTQYINMYGLHQRNILVTTEGLFMTLQRNTL
jgi:hypothetical protein